MRMQKLIYRKKISSNWIWSSNTVNILTLKKLILILRTHSFQRILKFSSKMIGNVSLFFHSVLMKHVSLLWQQIFLISLQSLNSALLRLLLFSKIKLSTKLRGHSVWMISHSHQKMKNKFKKRTLGLPNKLDSRLKKYKRKLKEEQQHNNRQIKRQIKRMRQ